MGTRQALHPVLHGRSRGRLTLSPRRPAWPDRVVELSQSVSVAQWTTILVAAEATTARQAMMFPPVCPDVGETRRCPGSPQFSNRRSRRGAPRLKSTERASGPRGGRRPLAPFACTYRPFVPEVPLCHGQSTRPQRSTSPTTGHGEVALGFSRRADSRCGDPDRMRLRTVRRPHW